MKKPSQRTRYIIFAFNLIGGCGNLAFGLWLGSGMSLSLIAGGFMLGLAMTDAMWLYFGSKVIPLSPEVQAQWDREMEAQLAKDAFRLVDQIEAEIDRRGLRGFVEEVKSRAPARTKH
jgi:hypothetical protein